MKTRFLALTMMAVLATTLSGCATSREMERVQADQKLLDAKAEQALQNAQAAKAAADAAKLQADAAAARAETAVKNAEEREKAAAEKEQLADEKAAKAAAVFQRSMRK